MKKLKNSGFTLVELVAIIVVLAAIFLVAFPILLGTNKKAEDREYKVLVDTLCAAGESYIYTSGNNYNISSGSRNTITISELIEYGVVEPDIKNPKTDEVINEDRLVFTTKSDLSLECSFEPTEVIPVPTVANACNSLVYNGNNQNLIKNPSSYVIYNPTTGKNAGGYLITASLNFDGPIEWSDKTVTDKNFTCTIRKAPLTPVAICDANKIYDGTRNTNCTINLTGIISGDSITATGNCLYDTENVGKDKTITCTNISITGTNINNYELTSNTATTTGNINNARLAFDPNGGVLVGTTPVYTRKGENRVFTGVRNSTVTTIPTATNVGYTFDGWMIGSSKVINPDGTLVPNVPNYTDSNGKWIITSNQNLTAKWVPNVLTINLYANGAQYDGSTQLTSDLLYSNRQFNYDGTDFAVDGLWNYDNGTFNLKKEGYAPTKYWHVGSSNSTTKIHEDTTYAKVQDLAEAMGVLNEYQSGNVTVNLYAGWGVNEYTIEYNANGGSGAPVAQTYDYAQTGTINLQSGEPTRTGYTFQGWSLTSTATTPSYTAGQAWNKSNVPESGLTFTLYAVWKPNTLKINFYANGAQYNGSTPISNDLIYGNKEFNYDGTDFATDGIWNYDNGTFNLKKTGHTATKYWHVGSANSTTKIHEDTTYAKVQNLADAIGVLSSLQTGDVTVNLYAGWQVNTYTIEYNANGGSGAPTSHTYEYAQTGTINLQSGEPTRTGYTFQGWSLSNTATTASYTPGQAWNKSNVPESGLTFTLYAVWEEIPKPTVTCTISGTPATGTGNTTEPGYLVGSTATCTCTGTDKYKPTSLVMKNGTTQLSSVGGNGTATISTSYTVTEPGTANFTAECNNSAIGTYSTGLKYFYREFTLTFNRNGATSISSSGGTQYLMANSTTGDGGHPFRSDITRSDRCGSECGVIGWEWKSANETTARIADNAPINLCWHGTSGCSCTACDESVHSSAMLNVTGAFTVNAITYGTISGRPETKDTTGTWARGYYPTDPGNPYLGTDNTVNIEKIDDETVKVYNTRNGAYAVAMPICAWVWGDAMHEQGTSWEQISHGSNAYIMYNDTQIDAVGSEHTIRTGGNPPGFIEVPIDVYDRNGWWCKTIGTGWNLTLHPNYENSGPSTTLNVQYGSRVYNTVTPPQRTGYDFTGYYTATGAQVYESNGRAHLGTDYWALAYPYTIWQFVSGDVNAYAHWSIHQNTLTVNPNGGSVEFNGATRTAATSVKQNYNTTIALPDPTKATTTNDNGTITVYYDEHGGTTVSDTTLTKKVTHTFTFTSWSDSGTCGILRNGTYQFPDSKETTCTKTANYSENTRDWLSPTGATLPAISRTGYTFNGWYDAASGGTRVGANPTVYVPTANTTLHAQWTAKSYTVRFSHNYQNAPTESRTLTYDSTTNNSFPASRTGYIFQGWYDSGGTQVYKADGNYNSAATAYWSSSGAWKYDGDVSLSARWNIKSSTLTVNPNGGTVTFNGADRTSSTSVTQDYATTIALPNPTKTTTTVDNGTITVSYDEHGGTAVSDATLTKKKTTVFTFASWSNSGTCGTLSNGTYYFPDSNGTTCTKTASWSESYNNFTSPSSITLPSISRTGYTFNGWYTAASGGTRAGANPTVYVPTANTTLHAQWTAKSYTVRFSHNYQNAPTESRTLTYDSTTNNSFPASRTGYIFQGWYDSGGTQVYKADGNYNSAATAYWSSSGAWKYDGDVSLSARWNIKSSTLTVNPNGGTVTFNGADRTSSTSVTQDYATTIALPNPTKTTTTVDNGTITVSYDEHGGTAVSDATLTKKKTTVFTFASWSNSGTCGTLSNGTYYFPDSNGTTCTKTASWSESYNNFTSPSSITLPSISRTGYTFNGWYTAASGGTRVGAYPTVLNPTASVTYHAQWSAKTYSVTFNPNYTTGSGQYQNPVPGFSRTMTYGSTSNNNVTISGYTRTGYTFQGWYTSASGGTKVYNANGSYVANTSYWSSSGTWKYDGTTTFYAHWTKD